MKSFPKLIDQLDKVFSEFVRARDSQPYGGEYFRCISCGQMKPYEDGDAGHFIPRTNMATRFDETNVWTECRMCNRMSSMHMVGYRKNLEKKIGEEGVEELLRKKHTIRKWSASELEDMIKYYRDKIKEIKNG